MSILTPPSSDVSVQLISNILGAGWQSWATGSSAAGGGGILGAMFTAVNTALLTLAGAVMLYTHATGAADMARQGQSKNNTWTFLRQSLSIGMLAPVPWANGLSIVQVVVMMVAGWSIGLADTVWDAGVNFASQQSGLISPTTSVYPIDNSVLAGIVKTTVIASALAGEGYTVKPYSQPTYATNSVGLTSSTRAGVPATPVQDGVSFGLQASGVMGVVAPQAMGIVTASCKPATCLAVQTAINTIINNDLLPQAKNAVTWMGSGNAGGATAMVPGAFAKAQADYSSAMVAAMNAQGASANSALKAQMTQMQSVAQTQGWASAGAFFYQMSKNNEAAASANQVSLSYQQPNMTQLNGVVPGGLTAALAAVDTYASNEESNGFSGSSTLASVGAGAAPGGNCPSWFTWDGFTCHLSDPAIMAGSSVINAMSGGGSGLSSLSTPGDPILGIQSASLDAINAEEGAIVAFAVARGVVKAAAATANNEVAAGRSVPVFGAILGAVAGPAAGAIVGASKELGALEPFFYMFVFMTMAFLFIGAYYLPLLPAIIFMVGVIGFLILVLEMLIGSTFWAFSHALPEGDGLMGSSGRAGYFHLLDILARPTLMIFGFFLTILLINAVFGFVGSGLKIAFASEMQGSIAGPASALAMIVITMGVVYAVVNKSVHLISTVPQTVMRWLGQAMGVDTGGIEVERQSHAYVGGVVGRARNPMEPKPQGGGSESHGPGGDSKAIAEHSSPKQD
ncbi:MAG: DotA/TraY family protein [Acidobacteriaceae bacterium]